MNLEADEDEKKQLSLNARINIVCSKASVYSKIGNYQESEKLAKEVLLTIPNSREATENLAKAFRDKQEFDKADEYFLKAIDLDPKHLPNYDVLALMRYWRGDPIGTIKISKKGIKYQKGFSDLIYLQVSNISHYLL